MVSKSDRRLYKGDTDAGITLRCSYRGSKLGKNPEREQAIKMEVIHLFVGLFS